MTHEFNWVFRDLDVILNEQELDCCVEETHVFRGMNRYDAPHHYGYNDVGYRGSQAYPAVPLAQAVTPKS